MPTTRRIEVAHCVFQKCVGHLHDLLIHIRKLVSPLEFLVIESSPYDVIIGLQIMIELRARPDYYRMVLKVDFKSDPEILRAVPFPRSYIKKLSIRRLASFYWQIPKIVFIYI